MKKTALLLAAFGLVSLTQLQAQDDKAKKDEKKAEHKVNHAAHETGKAVDTAAHKTERGASHAAHATKKEADKVTK